MEQVIQHRLQTHENLKPLIALKSADVKRDGRWLVRGVDLEVHAGEIVTLIGPNGSGKSTSAKMALGIIAPDEGAVERLAGLRVSYVPQKVEIDWTLPLKVSGFMQLTGKLATAEIGNAAGLTRSPTCWKHRCRRFQAVNCSGSSWRGPLPASRDCWFSTSRCKASISVVKLLCMNSSSRSVTKRVRGILLISHDLHVVMAATDRVVCFNGHVCCSGTPMMVSESDEYRKLFGERAAASFAIYRHDHDHTHLPDGRVRHADGSLTDHCHPDDGFHDHDHQGRSDHAG